MRLILGAAAWEMARDANRARMYEVERNRDVAAAVDFPA
jgi:hypothetical protein